MSEVIDLAERRQRIERAKEHYFGACPECGDSDGYVNAGRAHWFICHKHQTMWPGGCNLFSSCKEQTEAEQREIWATVEHYQQVEPLRVCIHCGRERCQAECMARVHWCACCDLYRAPGECDHSEGAS